MYIQKLAFQKVSTDIKTPETDCTEICFKGLMAQIINMTLNKWHFEELPGSSNPFSQTTMAPFIFEQENCIH